MSMTLMLSSTGLGSWAHTNLREQEEAPGEPLPSCCCSCTSPPPLPWGRGSEAWLPCSADAQAPGQWWAQALYFEEASWVFLRQPYVLKPHEASKPQSLLL